MGEKDRDSERDSGRDGSRSPSRLAGLTNRDSENWLDGGDGDGEDTAEGRRRREEERHAAAGGNGTVNSRFEDKDITDLKMVSIDDLSYFYLCFLPFFSFRTCCCIYLEI